MYTRTIIITRTDRGRSYWTHLAPFLFCTPQTRGATSSVRWKYVQQNCSLLRPRNLYELRTHDVQVECIIIIAIIIAPKTRDKNRAKRFRHVPLLNCVDCLRRNRTRYFPVFGPGPWRPMNDDKYTIIIITQHRNRYNIMTLSDIMGFRSVLLLEINVSDSYGRNIVD